MTNAPESRKTHVARIVGTNKAGEVLQDIWADVERMDLAKSATQMAEGFWQGLQRKFRWSDDPDADDYNEEGTPSRNTVIVKVCDPENEDDVNDPEEWIPIRVIKSLKARGGDAGDQNYVDRLINDELAEARKVTVRRIVHYDTNIDDAAQAAFDGDPSRKAYVVSGENYQRDDSTKDTGQFVEYEIIELLKSRNSNNRVKAEDGGADVDSGLQTKLLNQYLIDESDDPTGEVVGNNNINPPYRLDPYQNIVNVNFGVSDQQWLVGAGGVNPNLVFWGPPHTDATAKDGTIFDGKDAGASGLGFTVITDGYVVFGKITLSDGSKKSVFMRGTPLSFRDDGSMVNGIVSMGTVSAGNINWSEVYTAEGCIVGLSYANSAFFVSYMKDVGIFFESRLAVTFDGSKFKDGINPFAGTPSGGNNEANGRGSIGGAAAYNKVTNTYACVGSLIRFDPGITSVSANWGLITAHSRDGMSWTSSYTNDNFAGIGGQSTAFVSTVAAGNGVFVAAASKKNRYSNPPPFEENDSVGHSCGVVTSKNGASWTFSELPTAIFTPPSSGSSGGDTYAVAFIKDRATAKKLGGSPGMTGYFVASGGEFVDVGSGVVNTNGKIWMSLDGSVWSLIGQRSGTSYGSLTAISKRLDTTKIVIV